MNNDELDREFSQFSKSLSNFNPLSADHNIALMQTKLLLEIAKSVNKKPERLSLVLAGSALVLAFVGIFLFILSK